MTQLCDLTLHEVSQALADKRTSSVDATLACLQRIEATSDLGAWLTVDKAGALAQARAADVRRAQNNAQGPLDGVPLGLKDILLVKDQRTTCGSRILDNFVAPYDATCVRRLKEAGAVLLGKHAMDEFGMGSSTEHCAFGAARNPWDKTRVPGGSSGGTAAAVSVAAAFGALGTDTGGSIRQPAAFTGTVGLKPTYGRVSRFGVMAYASSLEQVGPMARTVQDCAMLLQVIAGHDVRDATCAELAVPDYSKNLEAGVSGMKLGVPKEYFGRGIAPDVAEAVQAALRAYEKLGAKLVDVSLPHTEHGIATYYIIAPAEASSNLARYDGVRYGARVDAGGGLLDMYRGTRSAGFGTEVKRRIMLGTYVLSSGYYDAYYLRAQKVRTLVRADFERVFQQVDALLAPTTPTCAFGLGEKGGDPLQMYMGDVFTVTANLAGLPAMSLPCGFNAQNLPVGLQILGSPFCEAKMLTIARAYERAHDWHTRRPV